MNLRKWVAGGALSGLLTAALGGCLPPGYDPADEQKEPHYLAGKARVNSLDFRGAIESYQKALEVNPRSASAHFELGWLFEEKQPDPAAAIYHYQQYLKLRPHAGNAPVVRERLERCKQELAKAVLPLPVAPALQRDFEQLAEENKRLREEVERWRTYYADQMKAFTSAPGQMLVLTRVPSTGTAPQPTGTAGAPPLAAATGRTSAPPRAPALRTHIVKAGENPSTIARRYGLKLEALLAANPGVDPHRLKVGQTLHLPPP